MKVVFDLSPLSVMLYRLRDASVQLLDQYRPDPSWKTVDERLQMRRGSPPADVHYGAFIQAECADVQHRYFRQGRSAEELERVRRTEPAGCGKSNKGRVQAYDGPILSVDAALYLMKHKPELGIKNPYELTRHQYKAALDLLAWTAQARQPLLRDAMIQIDDFKNEGVVVSGSWPFPGQSSEIGKRKDWLDFPGGRCDRLGRHHHAACG